LDGKRGQDKDMEIGRWKAKIELGQRLKGDYQEVKYQIKI